MVFSSVLFVFLFFPIVFIFYYLSKEQYRNAILLIASLIFYSCCGLQAFCLMLFSIIINYTLALFIDRNNNSHLKVSILIIDIAINLGTLFYFKYTNFGIHIFNTVFKTSINDFNIILPVGISFFTFQAMSYVIDVYRGEVKAEYNILNVGLYISFFPQLVAGPIVRYQTIAEQIQKRQTNIIKTSEGCKRFIIGFSKKIILANNLAIVAENFFNTDINSIPIMSAWIGALSFTLQIYYDFSGYSDMAIGLGKIFGFHFEENFNYPYIAKSITEFWRRWHISLSQWFRDYVYIPLGGGRVKPQRQIFNLAVVWFLTGLWHGAKFSFIAWGIIYFILLVFEKFLFKPEKRNIVFRIIWCIITLLFVNFEWILFYTESIYITANYIAAMFGHFNHSILNEETIWILHEYGIYFISGLILATPICPLVIKKVRTHTNTFLLDIILDAVYIIIFLWSTSFLILGAHNPFIYFNF